MKKKYYLLLLCLVPAVFLFFKTQPSNIYVYPQHLKQGDTVFIRIKSSSQNISGNFGNEKLVFYKKGKGEWISFLGIDAAHEPGNYWVSAKTSNTEQLTAFIKIDSAGFTQSTPAKAPNLKDKGFTVTKAENNIAVKDNPALNKYLEKFTDSPYFSSSFSAPLKVMQTGGVGFGKFITFAKSKLQHLGVDLRASEKTDVFAINDGKVVATLDLANYGKTIIIDHGMDIFSMYLHLEEFKAKENDRVKKGQLIGLSGDTGYSTAPHLHFSVRVGGARVDPVEFIKVSKKMDENFFLADLLNAIKNAAF